MAPERYTAAPCAECGGAACPAHVILRADFGGIFCPSHCPDCCHPEHLSGPVEPTEGEQRGLFAELKKEGYPD